jgi:hypothetical protein
VSKEINLSEFFPIYADIDGDKITIQLHKIIVGEISSSTLISSLRRCLALDRTEVDVLVKGRQLFLKLGDSSANVDERRITEIIGKLISILLPPTLRNQVTGNKLVYITRATGIPLMGRIDFGIIDRGTNLVQVRPITGCVLDCPFCSVDSGSQSKTRITDFIVDPDYLIDEVRRLCAFKGSRGIELHIDGQGEPTLYPYLPTLIKELSMIPGVETTSIQSNGMPLTEKLIDELEIAGLSRINLSLNALDQEKAVKLSGSTGYSLSHILEVIQRIRDTHISLLIAPLWIPGLNDDEILTILRFVKKLHPFSKWPVLGIQNYLIHRQGRKIGGVRTHSMRHFQMELESLESSYDMYPLRLKTSDFNIVPMTSYPKPFRKAEIAEIEILERGRMTGEMLGVGRGRALHILTGARKIYGKRRVRIIRTKHNVFVGELIDH